jgi:hypothetical protein
MYTVLYGRLRLLPYAEQLVHRTIVFSLLRIWMTLEENLSLYHQIDRLQNFLTLAIYLARNN